MADSRWSDVLLSRPLAQSEQLAGLLDDLGLSPIVLPAFDYPGVDARSEQPGDFDRLASANAQDLVVFTSPRAVDHGLAQIPADSLARARVGAIGPTTAAALADAGVRVSITPRSGYTSEALLDTLNTAPARSAAFIIAAPGGRTRLASGLTELGWKTALISVYRAEPAPLAREQIDRIRAAKSLLSVWTSANTIKSLSQRLPTAAWFKVCQGEWLVISERLQRLARAYGPARVHLAGGPDNASIVAALRGLL